MFTNIYFQCLILDESSRLFAQVFYQNELQTVNGQVSIPLKEFEKLFAVDSDFDFVSECGMQTAETGSDIILVFAKQIAIASIVCSVILTIGVVLLLALGKNTKSDSQTTEKDLEFTIRNEQLVDDLNPGNGKITISN